MVITEIEIYRYRSCRIQKIKVSSLEYLGLQYVQYSGPWCVDPHVGRGWDGCVIHRQGFRHSGEKTRESYFGFWRMMRRRRGCEYPAVKVGLCVGGHMHNCILLPTRAAIRIGGVCAVC